MKNIKTIIVLIMISCAAYAQDTENDTIERHHFNHWSVELNVGQNKPIAPFADGYYSSKPNAFFYFNGIEHYDLGIRYMFSNVFGVKLDFAYDDIKNQDGSGSLDFQTKQYRLGLQGVANLGRLLRFETFTHRFGLLAHGGLQVSTLTPMIGVYKDVTEMDGGFMYGLTPQFRLTNWLVITGDFTGLYNFRQHLNWDGSYSDKENSLSGTIFNTSLGLTVYLGNKDKKHADWYIPEGAVSKADAATKKRLDAIETLMNDTDRDGVPDYLDVQNNTPNGVAVDTKGLFIDRNGNNVPDEWESHRKDQDFSNGKDGKDVVANTSAKNSEAISEFIEKGYLNIFYDVNEDEPNKGATANVFAIIRYMKEHPQSKAKLTGFADLRGEKAANLDLSKRRAQKLFTILTDSGINASRISILGQGTDSSFPNTKTGYDLARRVSVSLE